MSNILIPVTYIKSIIKNSDGTDTIIVRIESACCKSDYLYERDKNGRIHLDGIEIGDGMYQSLKSAEKVYYDTRPPITS